MRMVAVAALAVLVGCTSSPPPPTAPVEPPLAQGHASVDLRVNAAKSGTFDCDGGLVFVASVLNETPRPLQVDSLSLEFTSVSGAACATHAPASAAVDAVVQPGGPTEVRRMDLTGDLCSPPHGDRGCEWRGTVTLATSAGALTDEIPFQTIAPPVAAPPRSPRPSPVPSPSPTLAPPDPAPLTCTIGHPRLVTPANGATVSGLVPVDAWDDSDSDCPITIGHIYRIRNANGQLLVETYRPLLEPYRWTTTAFANGTYRITAQLSCGGWPCGRTTDPIEVRVQN